MNTSQTIYVTVGNHDLCLSRCNVVGASCRYTSRTPSCRLTSAASVCVRALADGLSAPWCRVHDFTVSTLSPIPDSAARNVSTVRVFASRIVSFNNSRSTVTQIPCINIGDFISVLYHILHFNASLQTGFTWPYFCKTIFISIEDHNVIFP